MHALVTTVGKLHLEAPLAHDPFRGRIGPHAMQGVGVVFADEPVVGPGMDLQDRIRGVVLHVAVAAPLEITVSKKLAQCTDASRD